MRLKSLEIKGFKSFADKTVVNFDEGITGIIGPNGCGKSNIVDSIRWVIGEQKISHLRSENLESLVFNGSKTRSASGLAEVSLTFENTKNLLPTEFNTVTITRKFYKSGESEYRLNDVQCRLKDIQNLFMDTGVSVPTAMPSLNWEWWMISSKIKKTAAAACWNRLPAFPFIKQEKKKQN